MQKKYEDVQQRTNNFLIKTKLKDVMLQCIVWLGFLNGLSEEMITLYVQSNTEHPIPYECRDYMRRALEHGTNVDTVKAMADMSPEEAWRILREEETKQEREELRKLREQQEELLKNYQELQREKAKVEQNLKISVEEIKGLKTELTKAKKSQAIGMKEVDVLRQKLSELEAYCQEKEQKSKDEVENLVRERDAFREELEIARQKKKTPFFWSKEKQAKQEEARKENQKFFDLILSGNFNADQIGQLANGLERKIPMAVLFSVADPKNDAKMMKQMMECYEKLTREK